MPVKKSDTEEWGECSKCQYYMTRVYRDLEEYRAFSLTLSSLYSTNHEKVMRKLQRGKPVQIFWCRMHRRGPSLKQDVRIRCRDFTP